MFQTFSDPLWATVLSGSGFFLIAGSLLMWAIFEVKWDTANSKKDKAFMSSSVATFIVGVIALGGAVAAEITVPDKPVDGGVYSNPNDVVAPTYWESTLRGLVVRTDVALLEETLMEQSGADKLVLPSKLQFGNLQDGALKTFTGVNYGENGEDSVTVSGTFYYTDDALVIITDVDSEHQETVTIPTD